MNTNIEYWDEIVKNQPESYKKWFGEEKKYLQKKIIKDSKVLDVGCGNGRSIFDILSITKNVIGIDHDKKAVITAKENFIKYPTVKILRADAKAMPFDDKTFDFVICMGTFANFADDKIPIIKEMKRVLKKDGKIIISVFSEDAFDERMKLYKSLGVKIKEIKGTTFIFDESLGDNVSEQFSEQELRDIFLKAQLNIDEINKKDIAYLCTLSRSNANNVNKLYPI
jgi:ubiquinone/menaquinone biosynthesis C-methylase UbiE